MEYAVLQNAIGPINVSKRQVPTLVHPYRVYAYFREQKPLTRQATESGWLIYF